MNFPKLADTLSDIDESLHKYYTQNADGKWERDAVFDKFEDAAGGESAKLKAQVEEFRTTNINQRRQMEKLQEQLKAAGGNAEQLAELQRFKDILDNNEDARLIAEGKFEEVMDRRMERQKTAFDLQLKAVTEERDKATADRDRYFGQLGGSVLSSAWQEAFDKRQIAPAVGAAMDINARAGMFFDVTSDLELTARDDALDAKGQAMTPDTFVDFIMDNAPHLVARGKGAGGRDSDGPAKPGSKIAYSEDALSDNLDEVAKGKVEMTMD